jgi:hypothetical protein
MSALTETAGVLARTRQANTNSFFTNDFQRNMRARAPAVPAEVAHPNQADPRSGRAEPFEEAGDAE